MNVARQPHPWHKISISDIEDLRDAVLGAGLDATQMSTGVLSGGLVFCEQDGLVTTSGLIRGRVAHSGPLSEQGVTIGVGLYLAPGTSHWQSHVKTGNVGIFLPGDMHDSIYADGSLYATVTLPSDRLEEEAARQGLVLDAAMLGGTGVHRRDLDQSITAHLRRRFRQVHHSAFDDLTLGADMLLAAIEHLARPPRCTNAGRFPRGHGLIVKRARDYIHAHLNEPIDVDEIASAAATSRRTLFRAFNEILGESPRAYTRRLRLHRIRRDLANEDESRCTVAMVAMRWGMEDLGRMAGHYRDLFGELPSQTHRR